jgi:glutamate/tyrosine decarboxylase-like PLP-dependent enzyme
MTVAASRGVFAMHAVCPGSDRDGILADMDLPQAGLNPQHVAAALQEAQAGDADWAGGRTWSLVYHSRKDVDDVVADAHRMYLFANALNPQAFPSLSRLENEVVSMTASMLGAPEARGSMTSGGSESILMAVKSARDRARTERGVEAPKMVAPLSVHPAFDKAAHICGVEMVHTGLRADLRADVDAVADALDDRTVLVVGSAFGYPHGMIDPIPDLAGLAVERGTSCHVDACLGGFLLPFAERLGRDVPPWDLRVHGVTSISADVHKYGYAAKGASVLLHRPPELYRHQVFVYSGWPGGMYGTRAVQGARGGGPIAAAWAVMHYLGIDGYTELARVTLDTTQRLLDGVRGLGFDVLGEPDGSVFAFTIDAPDVFAVGDAMDARGWHLDRQQLPNALHLMVTPNHARVVDAFLEDLRTSLADAAGRRSTGAGPRYGGA